MKANIVGGVLAILMAAWPVAAEEQGDATAGHKLASQFCTACHIVGAERVGSDAAPPFRVIAEDPARRLTELHSWRGPMHPVLSNLAFIGHIWIGGAGTGHLARLPDQAPVEGGDPGLDLVQVLHLQDQELRANAGNRGSSRSEMMATKSFRPAPR